MRYPSVTTILQPFSAYTNARIPEGTLENAAIRGNYVHAVAISLAKKEWMPAPPPAWAGYIDSLSWWIDRYVDEVLLCEEELVDHELGFLGHPDLVFKSRGLVTYAGKEFFIVLVDWKTPLTAQKVWKAQLAGYKRLVEVDRKIFPDRIGSLQLSPKGKPPKFIDYTDDPNNFNAFYAALVAWKWFMGTARQG